MIELTTSHWVYLTGILILLLTMVLKKETPLVCISCAFVLAWVSTGNPIHAVQAVFTAVEVAFRELLGIVLIISIIVALAKVLEETGIAESIFSPIRRFIRSPNLAFWGMGLIIMVIAWLIWPSPAIVLVGTLLLPAAIEAGLPPVSAAMAISMFGYGIALTTDYFIQGAPSITAKAAGIDTTAVMIKSIPLAVTWAAIAIPLTYLSVRREIKACAGKTIEWQPFEVAPGEKPEFRKWSKAAPRFRKVAIFLIAVLFLLDLVAMMLFQIRGGDATALLGGTIALIMVIVCLGIYRGEGLAKLTEHGREGFIFGVRIFAPVFFIASFFFMGSPGTAQAILGDGAANLLFDLGQSFANIVPINGITAVVTQAVVGGITGLDGSGFSGLPLSGSLAQVLGSASHGDVATLAALGQFFCIAIGGGCVVPWALLPAAAITGTDPIEVARRNLMPTLAGLLGVIVTAVIMLIV